MSGLRKKIVFLPYDFDTAAGIDNYGRLVFGYDLEDIDQTAGGENVYSGQDSVLWKNVRAAFHSELTTMYRNLRSGNDPALSYEKIEKMFEDHQAKWPEALFNEDSKFKYIIPFVEDNENRLAMCLGSKAEQRKWWLYNRFKYIDSKYNAGSAAADSISFRGFDLPAANTQGVKGIDITPYASIYATVLYGTNPSSVRAMRDTEVRVPCPLSGLDFTDIYIYSASQIKSIGDLSPFKPDAVEFSKATHLQELKLGDSTSGYSNGNLKSLTLGNNTLLKKLDVRNCVNLGTGDQKTIDVSNCANIEEIYCEGTKIRGVVLPNGGNVKKLHLPNTITNLTILNQGKITEFTVVKIDPSDNTEELYSNIATLWIENSASTIPVNTILSKMAAGSSVRIIGFTMTASSTDDVEDFYDYLDTMKGLSESGTEMDDAQVSGTITGLGTITGAWYAEMLARYPYITIEYEHISSSVYFYNGSTLLDTVSVNDDGDATYSGTTPTKTQDAQYTYSFAGWSKSNNNVVDADALKHVEADRNVYACFTGTVRTYTVTFVKASDDGGGTLQTLSNKAYGTQIKASDYTGSTPTTSKGSATDYPFLGWNPSLPYTITGNQTFTAVFGSPVEVAEITDSWDTIIANIDNGTYKTKYKIGNYKPLDLGTEGTINMQIAGIDADVDVNGDTVPLTFIGMTALAITRAYGVHSSGSYTTNWSNSGLRTYLSGTLYGNVPSNVKSRIISVYKNHKKYLNTETVYDYLWIPSLREVSGYESTTGAYYSDLFKGNADRKRYAYNSQTAIEYLLRDKYNSSAVYTVTTNGSAYGYRAMDQTEGVVIGFCLGYEPETITDDWATILSNADYATDYSIGDTKYLDLGTEGKQLMEIVAFDTDDKADNSGKAKITWISKNLLPTEHVMNATSKGGTNGYAVGGWLNSDMRDYLKNTIKPLIPETVRSAIVEVTKVQSNSTEGQNSYTTNGQTSTDDVWIPSVREINLSNLYENTGACYSSKFTNKASRKKVCHAGNSSNYEYWLRSTDTFYYFRSTTSATTTGDSRDQGNASNYIALGFCTD